MTKKKKQLLLQRPSGNSFHQECEQPSSPEDCSSISTSLFKLASVSREASMEKAFVPSGKSSLQTLSQLLKDPSNLKKAFLLQEILKQKLDLF